MITYLKLCNFGQLGNTLFQLAAMMGIAQKTGYDLRVPPVTHDYLHFMQVKQNYCTDADIEKLIHRFDPAGGPGFFDPNAFTQPDFTAYRGYYQHIAYFDHVEAEVRAQFRFLEPIEEACKQLATQLTQDGRELVALHIRRTDYLRFQNLFFQCGLDYYHNALSYFPPERYRILVFSDDMAWCKNHLKAPQMLYCEGRVFEDLCMMTHCHHFIIANSTFSWWGAWLANHPQKKVIMPEKWFTEEFSHPDGLYLNNWSRI